MINLVFMGIQGSGKGTQASLMEQNVGLAHINIGERFRQHIKTETDLGEEAKHYVEQGLLCPDELAYRLIDESMRENPRGFVLDGFPRNLAQAEYLLEHYHIDRVFLFDLKIETAIERISSRYICRDCHADYNLISKPPAREGICDICGGKLVRRSDDNLEAIHKRFDTFHNQTDKVIEMFQQQNLLLVIDAEGEPVEIHREVIQKLRDLAP